MLDRLNETGKLGRPLKVFLVNQVKQLRERIEEGKASEREIMEPLTDLRNFLKSLGFDVSENRDNPSESDYQNENET